MKYHPLQKAQFWRCRFGQVVEVVRKNKKQIEKGLKSWSVLFNYDGRKVLNRDVLKLSSILK
jgi:hypothetical protein